MNEEKIAKLRLKIEDNARYLKYLEDQVQDIQWIIEMAKKELQETENSS